MNFCLSSVILYELWSYFKNCTIFLYVYEINFQPYSYTVRNKPVSRFFLSQEVPAPGHVLAVSC